MSREELVKMIIEAVGEETDAENIAEESSFMDDLDMSSLEIFSFIGELEARIQHRIPERILNQAATVGELADELMEIL